jgi:hypothetical protein
VVVMEAATKSLHAKSMGVVEEALGVVLKSLRDVISMVAMRVDGARITKKSVVKSTRKKDARRVAVDGSPRYLLI